MADEADMAQEIEELALKHALAHRKEGVNLPPKGSCYNCSEPLKPKKVGKTLQHVRLFCDEDCRDDWEALQEAKKRKVL
jgi:hypothetical protein